MKKLFILLALFAIMATGSAIPKAYYVSPSGGKVECTHISLRNNRAKVTLPSGEKVLIPLSEIESYSLNGRIYNKQILYTDNKPIKRVYMEKISERDGFSLYKYSNHLDKNGDLVDLYFVYKGNQYNSSVTTKNYKYVLPYFGRSGKVLVKN